MLSQFIWTSLAQICSSSQTAKRHHLCATLEMVMETQSPSKQMPIPLVMLQMRKTVTTTIYSIKLCWYRGIPGVYCQTAVPQVSTWNPGSLSLRIRPLKLWEQQGPNHTGQRWCLFLLIHEINYVETHPSTADAVTITSFFSFCDSQSEMKLNYPLRIFSTFESWFENIHTFKTKLLYCPVFVVLI